MSRPSQRNTEAIGAEAVPLLVLLLFPLLFCCSVCCSDVLCYYRCSRDAMLNFIRPTLVRRYGVVVSNEMVRIELPRSVSITPPVPASQSLTVLSSDADATSLPSGEKATACRACNPPSFQTPGNNFRAP